MNQMNSTVDCNQMYQKIGEKSKRFCKVHPFQECEFLFIGLDDTIGHPFKCTMCFDCSLDIKQIIPLKQIEMSDENTIFWNWPLPNNIPLLKRIKDFLAEPKGTKDYENQIVVTFKELRIKMNNKIDELEEKMINQAQKTLDFPNHLNCEYNRMSFKKTLLNDILDSQTDPQQLSIRIGETIASILRNQENTERILERELEEYFLQVNSVDFEGPKRIMQSALAQLDKMSIFIFGDKVKLAGQNKSSKGLGKEYQEASLSNNLNNLQTSNEKVWSSELIYQLISNPANQCAPEILRQLQEMLKDINQYFSQFPILEQVPLPIDLTGLSKNQLKNIEDLAKKMNELSIAPGQNYSSEIQHIPQQQFNTDQTLQYLKKYFFMTDNQEVEVQSLLTQLPILELLSFSLQFEKQLEGKLVKTYYENSQKLQITYFDNKTYIYQQESLCAQAISQAALQNDLIYELTCTFNKPFDCSNIRIGLIEESKADSKSIGDNGDFKTIFVSNSTGANTIIKGTQLTNSPLNKTLTTIKFRFCIQTQQLYIFDAPCLNVVKGDPSQIKSKGIYRFGVCFRTPGAGYGVTVSDIKSSKDITTIDNF